MTQLRKWSGPTMTDEAHIKIIKGETIVATRPNPHNADGYIPCMLKIRCTEVAQGGTSLELQAVDAETDKVLIELGTYHIPVGGSLDFKSDTGNAIMGVFWPFHIDNNGGET